MPTFSKNAHRPYVSEKAHIGKGWKYTYKPIQAIKNGVLKWAEPGEEVRCCRTLKDDWEMAMCCMVESLDGKRSGKVYVGCLKLNVDFRRK